MSALLPAFLRSIRAHERSQGRRSRRWRTFGTAFRPSPAGSLTTMDAIDLARWQFGIITVYHFLFVPITIGLSALVAGLHTAWYRTGQQKYRRMTQYWGKL